MALVENCSDMVKKNFEDAIEVLHNVLEISGEFIEGQVRHRFLNIIKDDILSLYYKIIDPETIKDRKDRNDDALNSLIQMGVGRKAKIVIAGVLRLVYDLFRFKFETIDKTKIENFEEILQGSKIVKKKAIFLEEYCSTLFRYDKDLDEFYFCGLRVVCTFQAKAMLLTQLLFAVQSVCSQLVNGFDGPFEKIIFNETLTENFELFGSQFDIHLADINDAFHKTIIPEIKKIKTKTSLLVFYEKENSIVYRDFLSDFVKILFSFEYMEPEN
jgi:hypothetical protein